MKTILKKYSDILSKSSETYVIRTFDKHVINIWTNKFIVFLMLGMFVSTIAAFYNVIFLGMTISLMIVFVLTQPILKFILSREECIVSDRGIIIKTGLFFTDVLEFSYKSIEAINVKQNPIGTYFGFGTLTIHGSGGTKYDLTKIEYPYQLAEYIQRYKFIEPFVPNKTFSV